MSNLEELKRKYAELGEEISRLEEEQKFNPHTDKLFLLSEEEYNLVKESIKEYGDYGVNWLWLRSPSRYGSSSVRSVYVGNSVSDDHVSYISRGVVPAFVEETCAEIGTIKIKYKFPFIYVGNDLWISETPIFWGRFDRRSSNYETSEIRQKILEWADKRG